MANKVGFDAVSRRPELVAASQYVCAGCNKKFAGGRYGALTRTREIRPICPPCHDTLEQAEKILRSVDGGS